jgi:sugar transferase EpsL
VDEPQRGWYRQAGKGVVDRVAALGLLVAAGPLMLAVAAVALIVQGRPVLFRQIRPGLGGQPFALLKFRTMRDTRDSHGDLLPDTPRLTGFGKVLRRTSLDELPQLLNVLRGELSLVGPRPLLVEYLPLYSEQQRRRHEVKPGITGLAQVSGRNALDWPTRLRLDVEYVDSCSLSLDLRILARTVLIVLGGQGISDGRTATTQPFTGQR